MEVLSCCFEGNSPKKVRAPAWAARRRSMRGFPRASHADGACPFHGLHPQAEEPGAPQAAAEDGLAHRLKTMLDSLVEEWGSALPLLQVRRRAARR
jgi:hypothetical protein